MKHILISLFLLGSLFSVYAQNDSLNKTPVIRDSTPVTTNNNMNNVRNDSTGSVNNSMKSDSTASMNNMNNSMKSDSTGSINNSMKSDSTAVMNNTMKTDSTGSVNNNSNMNSTNKNVQSNANANSSPVAMANTSSAAIVNIQNTPGLPGYASLPILESYVSADLVSKVKSKYNYVYDITSIKHTADQTAYVVRHLDNGVYKAEIIGEDGNVIQ